MRVFLCLLTEESATLKGLIVYTRKSICVPKSRLIDVRVNSCASIYVTPGTRSKKHAQPTSLDVPARRVNLRTRPAKEGQASEGAKLV